MILHRILANDGRELTIRDNEIEVVERAECLVTVLMRSGRMIELDFAEEIDDDMDKRIVENRTTLARNCAAELSNGIIAEGLDWKVDDYRFI